MTPLYRTVAAHFASLHRTVAGALASLYRTVAAPLAPRYRTAAASCAFLHRTVAASRAAAFLLPVRLLPVRLLPVRLLPVRLLPARLLPVRLLLAALIPAILLLALVLALRPAAADELVQVAPHRAASPANPAAPPLFGYLARPAGAGPFPAVVELHGCGGFGPHDIAAAERLKRLGYVALALDSLGNENHCRGAPGSPAEASDAHAALRYLAVLPFVQPGRIAVLGFSMGGYAALRSVEQGLPDGGAARRFRAAVAFYPPCRRSTGRFDAPALILIGDHDDWASAEACRNLAAQADGIGLSRAGAGAPIKLVVYPGATHAFDTPAPPRRYLGHSMQYDPAATRDAWTQLRRFLATQLAKPSATP